MCIESNRRCRVSAAAFAGIAAALLALVLPLESVLAQQGSAAAPAAEAENQLALRLGAGYSDNLFQLPPPEVSASYSALGLLMNLVRQTRYLDLSLATDLEYRGYSESTVDNELYGTADAALELSAVPDRVSWFIGDRITQGRRDPFQFNSPINRERINVLSTGPRLNLPLGGRTFVRLNATKSDRTFEDTSNLDGEIGDIELGLVRALNATTEIGLTLIERDTEYTSLQLDNVIETAALTYSRQLASGAASVMLGESTVDYAGVENSTSVFDINWSRDVGARSSLTFAAGREYIDAAAQNFQFVDPVDLLISADIYERTGVESRFTLAGVRSTFSVYAFLAESRYENDLSLDNDQQLLTLQWERSISNVFDIGVGVTASERDFLPIAFSDEIRRLQLILRRRFGQRVSVELMLESVSRDGLALGSVDENGARLFVQYDFDAVN